MSGIDESPEWRRSSFCSTGTCVETSFAIPGEVLVRDSKIENGPVLQFPAAAWREFASGIRAGDFRSDR